MDFFKTCFVTGLPIRFFEDDEKYRVLTLENAEGNRVGGVQNFRSMTEHQRLLQSSRFFQQNEFSSSDSSFYTKGTGNYNQFRRGQLDGYMKIMNITYAEVS